MAYITIVKGDDTDFLDNQYLVVKFNTDINMAGFKAVFSLDNIELTYPDLSAKYIEIILSNEVTSQLKSGKMYGTLKLIDSEDRIRTVTTVIPFNVVTKVTNSSVQVSDQSIQIDVSIDKNEFNVDMNIVGLSKTVAESYLEKMQQYDSILTEISEEVSDLHDDTVLKATEAAASASLSKQWATSGVLVDGTGYSAKYYAEQARETLNSFDSELENLNSTIANLSDINLSNITEAGKEVIKKNSRSGLEIGDIGIAPLGIDESKGLRRYLNGSTMGINTNTQAFVSKLKTAVASYPSLACSESEWQSIVSNSAVGQCGKFVVQDEEYVQYYAYSTTYYIQSTDNSESVNVYDSSFELQGTGSITDGVLTFKGITYDRASGYDTEQEDTPYYAYSTTYYTQSTDNNESVDVYNTSFELQGTGSISSNVLAYNEGTYDRVTTLDTSQFIEAYIRLPKIVMPIQGLTDLTKLGELVDAGLPNITGKFTAGEASTNTQNTGAFYMDVDGGTGFNGRGSSDNDNYRIAFDASLSNAIYGANETVQQEQIQYPYFIQIATGVETEVDITNEIELNNPFTLFDSRYTEAPLYNVSWLKSDGTYYSKSLYVTAYEALVIENNTEITAGESVTLPSGTTYVKRGLSVKLSIDEDITGYDFVINTSDETFRLPLKTNYVQIVPDGTIPVVGNGSSLGLYGDTSSSGLLDGIPLLGNVNSSGVQRVPYIGSSVGSYAVGTSVSSTDGISTSTAVGVSTNPEYSGLVADLSTLTTNSDLYLYYYVGETVENANLINAGRMAEMLPNKANTDLSNCVPSQSFIEDSINWGMPDYSAGSTLSSGFTADKNYIGYARGVSSSATKYVYVDGVEVYGFEPSDSYYHRAGSQFFIPKGGYVTTTGSFNVLMKYPLKGDINND